MHKRSQVSCDLEANREVRVEDAQVGSIVSWSKFDLRGFLGTKELKLVSLNMKSNNDWGLDNRGQVRKRSVLLLPSWSPPGKTIMELQWVLSSVS